MKILGIETSCDETAISVVEASGDIESLFFKLLGSAVNSQIEIHKEYGGVFPTLAKREHEKNLPIVLEEALDKAFSLKPEARSSIDLIIVTTGPGLEPALWTGIKFAEDLGKKWNVPVIGANHMEGHIASVLLCKTDANSKSKILSKTNGLEIKNSKIEFPSLALLISGGHTELILMESWHNKRKIGETVDDAVGEAFDKVARMLGLPYPGGPEISKLAEKAREEGIEQEKRFPRPMIHSKDYNFSFSGLKTSVLYYIRDLRNSSGARLARLDGASTEEIFQQKNLRSSGGTIPEVLSQNQKKEIAREFEDAVVEVLLSKTKKAIEEWSPKTLIIGGGVIANKLIRETFLNLKSNFPQLEILIPERELTTDNATMIAIAGYIKYLKSGVEKEELKADGNLDI